MFLFIVLLFFLFKKVMLCNVCMCELAEGEGVGCAEELWTVVVNVTHPAHKTRARVEGSVSFSQLWQNKEHVIVAGTFGLTAGTVLRVRLHHRKNNKKQNGYRKTSLIIWLYFFLFL